MLMVNKEAQQKQDKDSRPTAILYSRTTTKKAYPQKRARRGKRHSGGRLPGNPGARPRKNIFPLWYRPSGMPCARPALSEGQHRE